MSKEHLFVYGTLRRGSGTDEARLLARKTIRIGPAVLAGAELLDLGEYPGAVRTRRAGAEVRGDLVACDAESMPSLLEALDAYEEFDPSAPSSSLFLRRKERIRYNDQHLYAWVYWYNGPVDRKKRIASGRYDQLNRPGAKRESTA